MADEQGEVSEKARKIMKTAERLFAAGRFGEVTLDDICHEARVGKGTIYRYFEDKEDLYYQVIIHGFEELVADIRDVGREEQDPAAGLRKVAKHTVQFFSERRSLFCLMHSEALRGSERKGELWKKWHQRYHDIADVFAGFIKHGVEQGVYECEFDPSAAALLLNSMLRGGQRHTDEMPRGDDWPLAVVELFERGLRVRREAEGD
ncbi:MAG: TetR/AcrR family transcriptional regulator [Candidatus Brocadiia bacterium]